MVALQPVTLSFEDLCSKGCSILIQSRPLLSQITAHSLQRTNSIAILAVAEIGAPMKFLARTATNEELSLEVSPQWAVAATAD